MASVLTIEDDEITAKEILAELAAHGFEVTWAATGREGLALASGNKYDAITLDRMLPDMNGLEIVTSLRSSGIDTPILMISALSDVDERIRGLRAGGDDYLTKPFVPDEMAARLEVLLRRRKLHSSQTRLVVADLELDLISRLAYRGEHKIRLSPTEFRLLEYFMRNSSQLYQEPCCSRQSGVTPLIPAPTLSMCTLPACAERLICQASFHSFKQFADLDMSLVRLSDTWRTTTFRLVLLYGTMFAVGVVSLLALIYFDTENFIDQQTAHILKAELRNYLSTPVKDIPESFAADISRDSRQIEIYGLFSPHGNILAGNASQFPADMPMDGVPRLIQARSSGRWISASTDVWGVAAKLPDQNILFLGRRQIQLDEIRHVILKALAGAAFVILIGTALGVGLSIRPIRRIRAVQDVSQKIIQGDIGLRLPIAGSNDELDLLAQIVNKMLDEIAQRMNDIKGAADSVAHDLRTPLTHLRTKLSRLLNLSHTLVVRQVVEQAIEETDILLFRFRALLRISEISGSMRKAMFQEVALKPILESIQDVYLPLAEEKNISLNFDLPDGIPAITGDSALLFEALMNLVDNAVKFAPQGEGFVLVRLSATEHDFRIEIENNGAGIPAGEMNMVLQPFYRSEVNRHQSGGHGVGLSIVSAIVKLHGFQLYLMSENGITRAIIAFQPAE